MLGDQCRLPGNNGLDGLDDDEMVCPQCNKVVKRSSHATHLIFQCRKRAVDRADNDNGHTPSEPQAKMGLFAEYEQEKERESWSVITIKRPVKSLTYRPRSQSDNKAQDSDIIRSPKPGPAKPATSGSTGNQPGTGFSHTSYLTPVRADGNINANANNAVNSGWMLCPKCAEHVRTDHLWLHRCSDRVYVRELYALGIDAPDFVQRIKLILMRNPGLSAMSIASRLTGQYGQYIEKKLVNSVLYTFWNRGFYRKPEGAGFDDRWNPPRWYCQ